MAILFWLSVSLIAYAYAGYPALLWLRQRHRSWPVAEGVYEPTVSILIAARNEASVLPRKLANLAALDYPPAKLEVVIVSDGSTDGTQAILNESHGIRLRSMLLESTSGKPTALNAAKSIATGDILVFMDARQRISMDAVRRLVRNFADPEVGCVSGELIITENGNASTAGVGLYWRIEKRIRQMESAVGSVVGATGAIYAVRRELVPEIPQSMLVDDVYIPMNVVRSGKRVIFEPEALAWDAPAASLRKEFRRKVRTLTGNYQLIRLAPWLLTRQNPLLFELVSHKLLRLAVPFAMICALLSSLFGAGSFFQFMLFLQILFYFAAGVGLVSRTRLLSFASSFVMLNAAAMMAFVNAVSGQEDIWHRSRH